MPYKGDQKEKGWRDLRILTRKRLIENLGRGNYVLSDYEKELIKQIWAQSARESQKYVD